MIRSTKLILDDVREVLQMSSPDIPGDNGAIERALQDLSEIEKRHKKLLDSAEQALKFFDAWDENFEVETGVTVLLRNAINKSKGDDEN